jgi:hypothetical protein
MLHAAGRLQEPSRGSKNTSRRALTERAARPTFPDVVEFLDDLRAEIKRQQRAAEIICKDKTALNSMSFSTSIS